MTAKQLYPAVITLNRPETIFSDEDLINVIQNAMGAEIAELLRQRLMVNTALHKKIRKTISSMQSIISIADDLEYDVTDLEAMIS